MATTWLLAHEGGWDEFLLVLTPLVIFAALLAMARRRVDQLEHDRDDHDHDPTA